MRARNSSKLNEGATGDREDGDTGTGGSDDEATRRECKEDENVNIYRGRNVDTSSRLEASCQEKRVQEEETTTIE